MAAVRSDCRYLLGALFKNWRRENIHRCVCRGRFIFASVNTRLLTTDRKILSTSNFSSLHVPRVLSASLHSYHLLRNTEGTLRELDDITYEKLSDETLDELAEFFEDLGDSGLCHKDYDSSLSNGVLTIQLGGKNGTYVINKQSPNKQIWLSSPKSGPKRFDVIDGRWRYSHTGEPLHDLLSKEFSDHLDTEIDLGGLPHAFIQSDGDNWA